MKDKRAIRSVILMEMACCGYLVFQVFFALSRKGADGVSALVNHHLPFLASFITPLLSKIPEWLCSAWWISLFYTSVIVLFSVAYLGGLRVVEKFSPLAIWFTTSFFCITLFFFPPGKHHDIFLYIFQGKMFGGYHANPYFIPPAAFAEDPFYGYVGWQQFTSVYGPLWHWIEAGLFFLGGESIISQIATFRCFTLLAHLGNTYLVYSILRQAMPEQVKKGMLLFGWNPLLLLYSVPGSTNDMVMILFLLSAVKLTLLKKTLLSAIALTASGLVKIPGFFYLPFYLKMEKAKKEIAAAVLVMVIFLLVIWLPFYQGPKTFLRLLWIGRNFHHSWLFLWKSFWEKLQPRHYWLLTSFLQTVLTGAFLFAYWQLWRQVNRQEQIFRAMSVLLFFLLTIVLPGRTTWYASWVLPFAVLSLEERITQVALVYSLTALFAQVVYYLFHSYAVIYQAATMMIEIGPPLGLAIRWKIWRNIWERTDIQERC
ncbi:MAG: hypothetical protein NC911_03755 [Candidatus Omnitrophica bacterium]|nr:hypothetical protein [Candidatus Omnitrophota bacterium]